MKKILSFALALVMTLALVPLPLNAAPEATAAYVPGMQVGVYKAAMWDFDWAGNFGDQYPGLAVVGRDGMRTFIDKDGNYTLLDTGGNVVWFDDYSDHGWLDGNPNPVRVIERNGGQKRLIDGNYGTLITKDRWYAELDEFDGNSNLIRARRTGGAVDNWVLLNYTTGVEVSDQYYHIDSWLRDGTHAVVLGGQDRRGIINKDGREILAPIYGWITITANLMTCQNSQTGKHDVYNISSDSIVGSYDEGVDIENFQSGLTPVVSNGKWGYINTTGGLVIPLEYDQANPFANGLAAVEKDGKLLYINPSGVPLQITVTPSDFDSWDEPEKTAWASAEIQHINTFSETGTGLAWIWYGNEHRSYLTLINTQGNVVYIVENLDNHISVYGQISDGWAAAAKWNNNKDAYWDYINYSDGNISFLSDTPGYDNALKNVAHEINNEGIVIGIDWKENSFSPFRNGFAVVTIGHKQGIINTQGNIRLPAEHDFVDEFGHDRAHGVAIFGDRPVGTSRYETIGLFNWSNTSIGTPGSVILQKEYSGVHTGEINSGGYIEVSKVSGNSEKRGLIRVSGGNVTTILPAEYDFIWRAGNSDLFFFGNERVPGRPRQIGVVRNDGTVLIPHTEGYGHNSYVYGSAGTFLFNMHEDEGAVSKHNIYSYTGSTLTPVLEEADWIDRWGGGVEFTGQNNGIVKVGRNNQEFFYRYNTGTGTFTRIGPADMGWPGARNFNKNGLARVGVTSYQDLPFASGIIHTNGQAVTPVDGLHWVYFGHNDPNTDRYYYEPGASDLYEYATVVKRDPSGGPWEYLVYNLNGASGPLTPTFTIPDSTRFQVVNTYSEGLLPARWQNDLWGYIDKDGNEVVTPQYQYAQPFREGVAWFWHNGRYGLLHMLPENHIKPPSFSPGPGTYNNNVNINFRDHSPGSGVEIFFTIGAALTPIVDINSSSKAATAVGDTELFTGNNLHIRTPGTHTVRAVAVEDGEISSIAEGIYIVTGGSGGDTDPPPAATEPEPEPDPDPVEVIGDIDLESGTATVEVSEDDLADAIEQAGDMENAVITIAVSLPDDVDLEDVTTVDVTIPANLFDAIIETGADIVIDTPIAAIAFDNTALGNIAGEDGEPVTISANIVDVEELSDAHRELVGDRPVFDFTVMVGNTQVTEFGLGRAKIEIPYELGVGENPNAILVHYLADDGTLTLMRGRFDSVKGVVVFTTNHFSMFVISYNQISFRDIGADSIYYDAVTFLAARGITTGMGLGNNYNPESGMTRAMLLVMLMRAYGLEPRESDNLSGVVNFRDATADWNRNYLAKARMLGITQGTSPTRFSPDRILSQWELDAFINRTLRALGENYTTEGAYILTPEMNRGAAALVLFDYLNS